MSDDALEPVDQSGGDADPALEDIPGPDDGTGLLVEPDQGWLVDDEATVVAGEAVGDVGALSAEEAAVTVVSEDEAPGVSWDESPGYLDESET
jgi:hypothetical protein